MAATDNTGLGPPPLATPITATQQDQFGVPFQHRPQDPVASGNLAVSWAAWFNKLYQDLLSLLPAEVFVTQANLPTLGLNDVGVIANVTDYGHRLLWDGSAWGWAPGEDGSGYIEAFLVDPTGVGWHVCNGATVNYLKADGTLGSVTLPNLTGNPAFLNLGSAASATINPAVAPLLSGNTGDTGLSASQGSTSVGGTGTTVATGGITISPNPHHHDFGTLVADTSGVPQNVVMKGWFRQ